MSTDIYEGHSPHCHAVQPGDRECNCHLAYGFATAEAMEEQDRLDEEARHEYELSKVEK